MERSIPVSEGEYRILKKLVEYGIREGYVDEVSARTGIEKSTLESILGLLADKGIVDVEDEEVEIFELTDRGFEALTRGLPEEKLVHLLSKHGGRMRLDRVKEVLGEEAGIAVGLGVRSGFVRVREGFVELISDYNDIIDKISYIKKILNNIKDGKRVDVPRNLLKRGLVKVTRVKKRKFRLLDSPQHILEKISVEKARLTHEMLRTGSWKTITLRRYNIKAEPPRIYPALPHYLSEFLEMLRDLMKELGFREVTGPMVEIELYNFDLLFQPQDHPAREIHDTLRVSSRYDLPAKPGTELLQRVGSVHEKGWNYKWSQEQALRLVLRSQTTSVSARILASRPKAPLRVFTLGRVFRSDVVDATHLPEFHQLDGLDGDYDYTFRDLLAILKEISGRLGFEVKFKPAYFPFTEPSVEGYVRLPNGRWLELFGAGMMRPEVLEMAGVDYPVGAWGFGVERLAAVYYGFSDIRMLYTRNVDVLRRRTLKLG